MAWHTRVKFNISHKFIRVKEWDGTDVITIRMFIDQEIYPLVEIGVHPIEVKEVLAEVIDQITVADCGKILEMTTDRTITGMTTDGTIIEITIGKTMEKMVIEIQDLGIEVEGEMDIEITTEIIQERTLNETGRTLAETEEGTDNCNQEL